jgi:serine/threonine-protein kinase HipA
MGRKSKTKALYVLMNGQLVGQLTKTTGVLTFEYNESWLDSKAAIPLSLSIPLSSSPYRGDTVYRFFDNLLPDSGKIRERMQATLTADSVDAFDLLAKAGADCIGAIQLVRSLPAPSVKEIRAKVITEKKIAEILKSYRQLPLGMTPEEDGFRISLAGQQEKSAFLWHEEKWKRPYDTTPTSHIFKLPIGQLEQQGIDLRDSVENEWLCLKIAQEFGLRVPEATIGVFESVKVLIVERFDRQWSADSSWLIRLPQEDLCQALDFSPGQKCESDGGPGIEAVMKVLLQSTNSLDDRRQFMRSQILFWLMAAPDGHAKNFSIHLEPGGRFKLAPFYDIISAYPLIEKKELQPQRVKLAMAPLGKNKHYRWNTVQTRHWKSTANICGFPENEVENILLDFSDSAKKAIEAVKKQLPEGFPEHISNSIFEGILRMCASIQL